MTGVRVHVATRREVDLAGVVELEVEINAVRDHAVTTVAMAATIEVEVTNADRDVHPGMTTSETGVPPWKNEFIFPLKSLLFPTATGWAPSCGNCTQCDGRSRCLISPVCF